MSGGETASLLSNFQFSNRATEKIFVFRATTELNILPKKHEIHESGNKVGKHEKWSKSALSRFSTQLFFILFFFI